MKRKMTITLRGADGEDEVGLVVEFDPALDMKESMDSVDENSGWAKASSILMEAIKDMSTSR